MNARLNQEHEADSIQERHYRLARRTDLAMRYGIIITVPEHTTDEHGNWRFGIGRPVGGWAEPKVVAEFSAEMQQLIDKRVVHLVQNGVLTEEEAQAVASHPYETGPAAQSWPQLAFDLYGNIEPLMTNGATLLTWAYFFKDVFHGLKHWAETKEEETKNKLGDGYGLAWPSDYTPRAVLTQPALIAVCYADLVDRHGKPNAGRIDILPRERFAGYATPDHPSGGETYLIRFSVDDEKYVYLVDGTGTVLEHYVEAGDAIRLLPLADLLPVTSSMAAYRDPYPAICIEVVEAKR